MGRLILILLFTTGLYAQEFNFECRFGSLNNPIDSIEILREYAVGATVPSKIRNLNLSFLSADTHYFATSDGSLILEARKTASTSNALFFTFGADRGVFIFVIAEGVIEEGEEVTERLRVGRQWRNNALAPVEAHPEDVQADFDKAIRETYEVINGLGVDLINYANN